MRARLSVHMAAASKQTTYESGRSYPTMQLCQKIIKYDKTELEIGNDEMHNIYAITSFF